MVPLQPVDLHLSFLAFPTKLLHQRFEFFHVDIRLVEFLLLCPKALSDVLDRLVEGGLKHLGLLQLCLQGLDVILHGLDLLFESRDFGLKDRRLGGLSGQVVAEGAELLLHRLEIDHELSLFCLCRFQSVLCRFLLLFQGRNLSRGGLDFLALVLCDICDLLLNFANLTIHRFLRSFQFRQPSRARLDALFEGRNLVGQLRLTRGLELRLEHVQEMPNAV